MTGLNGQSTPTAETILAKIGAAEAVAAHNADAVPEPEPWDAPVPLGERGPLPTFPVDALPGWVADQVQAVSTFTQTPVDLAACIALACLSTAAGGRAIVAVRGGDDGWREPVNIYTAVAMHAGSRKSAVFTIMTAPLLAAEKDLVDQTAGARIEAEQSRKLAEKDAAKAEILAANADSDRRDQALADAISAAMAIDQIHVPAIPQLVADDLTPEAAASLLAEQGGRLALLSAEGGIFAAMAGRYTGVPSIEVLLKGHAGDLLRVNRKGRAPEHVAHPALTMGLAVQPSVFRDIAGMPGFRDRGLLARILYSLPTNTVGRRQIGAPPVPAEVSAAYSENLRALVCSLAEWTDPAVLPVTPDADQVILELERAVEPRMDVSRNGDLAHIADWANKHTGATIRIAALIHLSTHLRDGWGRPIDAATIAAAARIGDYYLHHALAAFDLMGADPRIDDARALLDQIRRAGKTRVTKRELFTGAYRGRFAKATDLNPALVLLEEHGYLRRAPDPERAGPGRKPSPTYDVNPSALSAESRRAMDSANSAEITDAPKGG